MIVILDHDEAILEWMDDADASIEITDTYGGYRALDFTCQLKNVKSQQYLLKQGNKLFLEGILFVINTEVEFDYVSNLISLEAEELVCEMNNCHPFYINDPLFGRYVSGNTLAVSKTVISLIFQDFYTVKETDLELIDYSQKLITVNGTITRYNLLKEIESATGLMFKYEYRLDGNDIIKEVSLLKPENYGVTHDKLLERVTVGENTNKLEYNSDETKNALGIMPIIKSENNSNVDYTRILKQFYDLDINNERVMPYYNNYNFTRADILAAARTLYTKIDTYKFIPETVKISNIQNEEEITLDIGMGQFVDLATRIITNISLDTGIPLTVVECPKVTNYSGLNCVFTATDIINLARNVQDHITKSGEVNSSISTNHGLVSFQWLIYIFSEYLTTSKKVVVKSTEYPDLNKILPSTVEDKVLYIVDTDNYEYMPFMYTQNTSESKNLPFKTPMNPLPEKNMYDLNNYISESYPEMIITKEAGADNITVTITKQNISQNTPETFILGFKDVSLIQDNSDITIDFSKKEIRFMKFFERIEEKQIEVTETVENGGTITVNMMPSCSCCGYPKTPYKRYTKTWKNYCPACGKSGTLTDNPKGVYEGEITCSMKLGGCDADYCGYCGGDKWGNGRCEWRKLTPAEATSETTSTKTIQEVVQEYKEVTANDDATDESETKIKLSDILTTNSRMDSFHGDVSFKITGATLKSLTCDSTKLYELAPFPYVKQAGEMFIYAPITSADFNYTHMTNDNPKLEPFETSEQSVEEVLIGCWKKLNGSGDNTAWLEKAEDINVDLSEENLELNAGDFVFIKLPDTNIFKAQIVEKKYDPKIKSDSSLKIGNVTRESIK